MIHVVAMKRFKFTIINTYWDFMKESGSEF
jgi:hypothetical protein